MDTDFQSQLGREDLSARSRILHVSAVLNEVLMSIGNIGNICVRKHLSVSQVEFSEPIRREAFLNLTPTAAALSFLRSLLCKASQCLSLPLHPVSVEFHCTLSHRIDTNG